MATWATWCTSSSSTASTSATWDCWNTTSTATTTYSTNNVWVYWVDATDIYQVVPVVRQMTEEQQAEHRRAHEERQRRAEERRAEQLRAEARAKELLRANLSQKQREALDKNGWFLVEGGKSKRSYKLHENGRMEEMEGDAAVASFCVHAEYTIPIHDQVLAKALFIQLDEEHILRTANRTNLRRAA